ncbi:unnamed protein product [Prorocentrum cordatum]|uniref:Uncharacterized protein n=1 Tax=Prorocentrum cordatum TaxID=2364126 RepID=A0ABN9VHJ2_9DINO|nr:unnamed protein product [Polarella glacialis]
MRVCFSFTLRTTKVKNGTMAMQPNRSRGNFRNTEGRKNCSKRSPRLRSSSRDGYESRVVDDLHRGSPVPVPQLSALPHEVEHRVQVALVQQLLVRLPVQQLLPRLLLHTEPQRGGVIRGRGPPLVKARDGPQRWAVCACAQPEASPLLQPGERLLLCPLQGLRRGPGRALVVPPEARDRVLHAGHPRARAWLGPCARPRGGAGARAARQRLGPSAA